MDWKKAAKTFGLLAPVSFIILTAAAIYNYPGYDVTSNFLSDLGAAENSAVLFNLAVIVAGTLAVLLSTCLYNIYDSAILRKGSFLVGAAGFFLICVGAFPLDYGIVHTVVSAAFFILTAASLVLFGVGFKEKGRPSIIIGLLIAAMFVLGISPIAEHAAVSIIIIWMLFVFARFLK